LTLSGFERIVSGQGKTMDARNHVPATPRARQEMIETLQRLRLGGAFYVFAWLFAGLAGGLPQSHLLVFALVGLAFIALGIARLRIHALAEGASADAVARRIDACWAIVFTTSVLWGGASAWLLGITVDESARTVTAVSSYAFSTAFAHNFSMRRQRALIAILIMYVPTMVAYLLTGARFEFVAVGSVYLIYVVFALKRSHREYLERLDLEDALRRERDRFEDQSQRDGLTGLANRRHFSHVLDEWIAGARAAPMPFVLMIFDRDWFKSVNDRHGHAVGDATLRAFAQQLQAAFNGPREIVARLGGEEFAVLLPDCAVAAALPRADAFRAELAGRPLPIAGLALGLTVSVGVGGFEPRLHADGDALYHAVDQALYRAKASGRNTVREATVTSAV
jgi:diguanylate cyclase (GGDEF)-like protein